MTDKWFDSSVVLVDYQSILNHSDRSKIFTQSPTTTIENPELIQSVGVTFEEASNYTSNSNRKHGHCSDDLVLRIDNLCKSYEEGKPVLNKLCMNVKRGTIYGLLGSSGCGKTSLLSCVVGLNNWDSGDIFLFGKRPYGHPGKKVGFMPQDIALYDQITIGEMMAYYGRLYGMTKEKIEAQWLWIADFLQLPTEFKIIKDLSGGQKRRASLSLCLLHSPELLILDEPTVGLDPLLRESIWQHLTKMARSDKTTVIVTTHYIEETKLSDTIGVMRKGRLLVEQSPTSLLRQYQCEFLEQVVTKLCYADERFLRSSRYTEDQIMSSFQCNSYRANLPRKRSNFTPSQESGHSLYDMFEKGLRFSSRRMSSLRFGPSRRLRDPPSTIMGRLIAFCRVIWLLFWRNPMFMVMVLFLPTFQIIITLAIIGREPNNIMFGVIDQDSPSFDFCFNNDLNTVGYQKNLTEFSDASAPTCDLSQLSCSLISELRKTGVISLEVLSDLAEAQWKLSQGEIWGYFHFQQNFSRHMENFVLERRFATNETLEGSKIPLVIDRSSYLLTFFSIQDIFQSYQRFIQNIASQCGTDPREVELPLFYRKPVYGNTDISIKDYIMIIVIPMVIFEVPMMMTSILFINDVKQGTFDRARVAGLKFKEVMLTHFITQGSVIIGQTAICFTVTSFLYNFGATGHLLYFIFSVLCGLCGEGLGLFLGVVLGNEIEALLAGLLIGVLLLTSVGMLWPVEMMGTVVRNVAYYGTPTSRLGKSARAVLYKGQGILHPEVWQGIVTILGWIVGFWIVSSLIFIRKHTHTK